MTTLIIICVSIYLLATFACWNWLRIAYSAGGVNEGKDPVPSDLWLSIVPLLNIVIAWVCWSEEYPRKDEKKVGDRTTKWLNRIFCIKK